MVINKPQHRYYASNGVDLYSFCSGDIRAAWIEVDTDQRVALTPELAYQLSIDQRLSPIDMRVVKLNGHAYLLRRELDSFQPTRTYRDVE